MAIPGGGAIFQGSSDVLSSVALYTDVIRIPSAVVANGTVIERFWAPTGMTLVAVTAYLHQAAVTAGTYTLAVANGATTLLAGATADLTTLVAATPTSIPLTATTANLNLAANTVVTLTITSNNADLTGSGLVIQILYKRKG